MTRARVEELVSSDAKKQLLGNVSLFMRSIVETIVFLAVIERDLEEKPRVAAVHDVEKLVNIYCHLGYIVTCLYRHTDCSFLSRALRNFVSFDEFYATGRSVFQIGRLYMVCGPFLSIIAFISFRQDGRCCKLVFAVDDIAKHATHANKVSAFKSLVQISQNW